MPDWLLPQQRAKFLFLFPLSQQLPILQRFILPQLLPRIIFQQFYLRFLLTKLHHLCRISIELHLLPIWIHSLPQQSMQ